MNAIDRKLFAACKNGDYLQVIALLAQGANPNALNENRQTPLMIAARYGHANIINLLVRYGADPHIKDDQGRNALHHAIENQQYDAIFYLVSQYDLDPRELTADEQDALTISAGKGDIALIDIFVRHGVKPRQKALEEAILNRQVKAIRHLILNYGLDPNSLFNDDVTPFLLAARVGDIPTLDTLVELGAIPDHVDILGQNALHIATKNQNHDMMCHLLVRYGIDPNARTKYGKTALLIAAENGDIVGVDILLQHGANPHLTDRNGYNVLLKAVANRHLALVSHLLTHCSLDVNQPCHDGRTAFLIAAANRDIPMLDLLAQFGANPHHYDKYQRNAIAYAYNDYKTIQHLIARYGVDPNLEDVSGRTILFRMIEDGVDVHQLIQIINDGADPHYVNRYGQNVIHFATLSKRDAVIRYLVMNFMVNPNQCDHNGLTPFLLAAEIGNVRILHLLTMLGASPYHTDHSGRNALHISAKKGNPEATRYLITRFHLDPNAADHDGYSPLVRSIMDSADNGTFENDSFVHHENRQTLIDLGSHYGSIRTNPWALEYVTILPRSDIVL